MLMALREYSNHTFYQLAELWFTRRQKPEHTAVSIHRVVLKSKIFKSAGVDGHLCKMAFQLQRGGGLCIPELEYLLQELVCPYGPRRNEHHDLEKALMLAFALSWLAFGFKAIHPAYVGTYNCFSTALTNITKLYPE